MATERWQRIKNVFDEALELEPGRREDYVRAACCGDEALLAEVLSMLHADAEGATFFEEPLVEPAHRDPLVGRTLGPYLILSRIGRGGMGSVYLAQRADDQFRRRVAVKAVRPDLLDEDTLRRFQNERQTLAVLDQPNIIKLLDGGTTEDGIPYLVMDYAEGEPIVAYAERRNLTVRERLELFRTVCAAVHYAHQNLVVHRDLKPDNILVTPDGVPKLLDFGIAKLLRPEYLTHSMGLTRTHLQPMTPEYASPEQFLGLPVTTASDIYSLGVLLYVLLTGHHPFESSAESALTLQKAICEEEPERPSVSLLRHTAKPEQALESRARLLRGDLDRIVLMAMRKEPQRRYASAEHLADDIRRHLAGLPVSARKSTLAYLSAKFVTRHKAGVGVAALVTLALGASLWTARLEYLRAKRRFEDLRQFANFAITDLDDALREGTTPAREKLVARATVYLDNLAKEAANDAGVRRDLIAGYVKMGDVQGNLYGGNLGKAAGASESYRKALGVAEPLVKANPYDLALQRDLARIYMKLGDVAAPAGDHIEALARYRQSSEVFERLVAAEPGNAKSRLGAMVLLTKLGYVQGEMGDVASALASFRNCLKLGDELDRGSRGARMARAFAQERIAYFSVLNGTPAGAEASVADALRVYQEDAGPKPAATALRNIAQATKTLAEVRKRLGKPAEALDACRQSLAQTEDLLRTDPQNTQLQIDVDQALVLLIDLLHETGPPAEARLQTVRALTLLRPLAEAAGASQYHLQNYAWILLTTPFPDLRNAAGALASAQRAVELTRGTDPRALDLLGRAYEQNGDPFQALETERKALSLLPAVPAGAPAPELRLMLSARVAALSAAPPADQRKTR